MPPPPNPQQRRKSTVDCYGVANANSTLNAFMGAKQKSWMTNGSIQAVPRTNTPRSQQQQQQSILPANVLPSPAPSDEPSPAVSNPRDSPNPQSVHPTGPQGQSTGQPAGNDVFTALDTPPLITDAPQNNTRPETTAAPNENACRPMTSIQASNPESQAEEIAESGRMMQQTPGIALPSLPNANNTIASGSNGANSSNGSRPNSRESRGLVVPSRLSLDGEHPNKRRRVQYDSVQHQDEAAGTVMNRTSATTEHVTYKSCASLIPNIEQHIAAQGGELNLSLDTERVRFQILRDACAKNDRFYLALHQLFCMWSLDPKQASIYLPACTAETLSRGFGIVATVIKKNDVFSPANLEWCANFPEPLWRLTDPHAVYSTAINQVGQFLISLSHHWLNLLHGSLKRRYPYLMDEMVGKLRCLSLILQQLFFTASRRRLGATDGQSMAMDDLFRNEQQAHMTADGQFQAIVPCAEDELERRNQHLVSFYRAAVARAKQSEHQRGMELHQHAQAQQARQNQFMNHQPIQQTRQPQRNPTQIQLQQNRGMIQAQQVQQVHGVLQQSPMSSPTISNPQSPPSVPQADTPGPVWRQASIVTDPTRRFSHTQMSPSLPSSTASQNQGPQMAMAHAAARSPAISQNSFRPSTSQGAIVPPSLVLQSSPTTPTMQQQMMQQQALVNSPQQHSTWQGLLAQMPPHPQQFQANLQNVRNQNAYNQQMVQRPGQRGQQMLQGQQMQQMPSMQYPSQAMVPPSPQMTGSHQAHLTQQMQSPFQGQLAAGYQMPPVQSPGAMGQSNNHFTQPAGAFPFNEFGPMLRPLSQQQMYGQQGRAGPHALPWTQDPNRPLIPPPGQRIERSDWAHSHHERTSLIMSLHQAHVRSPDRVRRQDGKSKERHYQAVRSFAFNPVPLTYLHDLDFTINDDDFSRLCKEARPSGQGRGPLLPVQEYENGTLRYRLRCCQLQKAGDRIMESDWVVMDVSWPQDVFMQCNGHALTIRRAPHNGKDLPVELTGIVVAGVNKLKVVVSGLAAQKAARYFLAVEVVETLSHSEILDRTWKHGLVSRDETLKKIQTRVGTMAPEDAETIAVTDKNGNLMSDLSIDLTDPFMSSIFTIPARGKTCSHMECFDLETWLNTRPRKPVLRSTAQDSEPSQPDKWKCPICFKDARPGSLLIDSFLYEVRQQLQKQNKLGTKSILVAVDGKWRPVIEPVDDDDASSDGETFAAMSGPVSAVRKKTSKSVSVEPRMSEVIEID